MHNKNESVRRSIERTFKVICSESMPDARQVEVGVTESPRIYILRMLLRNLPEVDVKSDHCEEYFNLTTYLMKLCQNNFKAQEQGKLILEDGSFSSHALLEWCIRSLRQRPTYEDRYF